MNPHPTLRMVCGLVLGFLALELGSACAAETPIDVRILRRALGPVAGPLTNAAMATLESKAPTDPAAALALAWRLAVSQPPQPDATRRWVERAAESGHATAQYVMGALAADTDRDTDGPAKGDYESARDWWEKASNQGHAEAAVRLGDLFWNGDLDVNDGAAARVQWERAAAVGVVPAQRRLGLLYLCWREGGELLSDCDPDSARQWFERAAQRGDPASVRALRHLDAWTLKAREAQRPLRRWLIERLQTVNNDVSWVLGSEGPREGPVMETDGDAAIRAALRFAREDPDEGLSFLVSRLPESPGSVRDSGLRFEVAEYLWRGSKTMSPQPQRAVDWYLEAARGGHAPALRRLGEFWRDGLSGEADPAEAERWFRRAAAAR